MRAEGIDKAEGKQKIVVELYDKFFRNAFPKMTERLGIVYTPVEVVDFIIHSINDLLQSESVSYTHLFLRIWQTGGVVDAGRGGVFGVRPSDGCAGGSCSGCLSFCNLIAKAHAERTSGHPC